MDLSNLSIYPSVHVSVCKEVSVTCESESWKFSASECPSDTVASRFSHHSRVILHSLRASAWQAQKRSGEGGEERETRFLWNFTPPPPLHFRRLSLIQLSHFPCMWKACFQAYFIFPSYETATTIDSLNCCNISNLHTKCHILMQANPRNQEPKRYLNGTVPALPQTVWETKRRLQGRSNEHRRPDPSNISRPTTVSKHFQLLMIRSS